VYEQISTVLLAPSSSVPESKMLPLPASESPFFQYQ